MTMITSESADTEAAEASAEMAPAVPPVVSPRTNPRRRALRRRAVVLAWQLAVLGAFVGLWQIAYLREWARPLVLRSPGQVWDAGFQLWRDDLIGENLAATLKACLIALVLAAIVGIAIGLTMALLPRVERVITPFFTAMNSAPRIAFAPVFIIIFGITTEAKVALAFSVVVFVLILNARAGVHAADPDVVRLMEVMGARKHQIFTKLLLPVATPSIFAGLRLGLIYALLGVVTSEMISAKDGMGQLVARYSANFELDKVYALIIVLIVVASVLNMLMGVVERRLLWWQPPTKDRER